MNETQRNGGRLVVGYLVMALGALLLLDQIGLLNLGGLHRLWPLLLIGFGVAQLARHESREGRWSGYWLVLVGLYCGASVWHWFGLSWRSSWPLMVIAAGIMIVARALSAPEPEGKEKHEPVSDLEGRAS